MRPDLGENKGHIPPQDPPFIGTELPELAGTAPDDFPYFPSPGEAPAVVERAVDITGAFGADHPVTLIYIDDGGQHWIEFRVTYPDFRWQSHIPVDDRFGPANFNFDGKMLGVSKDTLYDIVLANAPNSPESPESVGQ